MDVGAALLRTGSTRVAAGVLAASFVLPPEGLGFPTCIFHALTDLPCPGCGMTRSLIAVAHGDLARAVEHHAFGPVVFGVVVLLAIATVIGERRREAIRTWLRARSRSASRAYLAGIGAFVVFGLARLLITGAARWAV